MVVKHAGWWTEVLTVAVSAGCDISGSSVSRLRGSRLVVHVYRCVCGERITCVGLATCKALQGVSTRSLVASSSSVAEEKKRKLTTN